jgi:cell division protein FtsZ
MELIQFEMPQKKSSIIKVIGVGGGGGNAVDYMFKQGIEGVDFVLCNTDIKALDLSNIPTKIQLGPNLTSGLGAGAKPAIGQQACEESIDEIKKLLGVETKMVFITAGMGGGTGTGAAPVVSKVCKELGILTVGIVTTPFTFEGKARREQAVEGIAKMKEHVDTILIISNDKVRALYGSLGFKEAFEKADGILAMATKCITDVINSKGTMIVDFADVCTVMRDGGVAILGSSIASGANRALEAVEKAVKSPLLNDSNIVGAKWVLLNINSANGEHQHTLEEMDMIQEYVQNEAGNGCDVILGMGTDDSLIDAISVTIIATGFTAEADLKKSFNAEKEEEKTLLVLNTNGTVEEKSEIVELVQPTLFAEVPEESIEETPKFEVNTYTVPNAAAMNMRPALMAHTAQVAAPIAKVVEPKKTVFELSLEDEMPIRNDIKEQEIIEPQDEIIMVGDIEINRRMGSRYLSDEEIQEKIEWEQKKRKFDDRATRLRNISHSNNLNGDSMNDIENIPAFMRNQKPLEDYPASDEKVMSEIQISPSGNIETRNTFLDGDVPC